MITIHAYWDEGDEEDRPIMSVGFDAKSSTNDCEEFLRQGEALFRSLFIGFLGAGGRIHFFPSQLYASGGAWPRGALTAIEIDLVIEELLRREDEQPYPLVVWLEPSQLRLPVPPTFDDFEEAAKDRTLLTELVHGGFMRMFIEQGWADLLCDPRDRNVMRRWIENAISGIDNATAEFTFAN